MKLFNTSSLVSEKKILSRVKSLSSYIDQLQTTAMRGGYDAAEASMNLAFDVNMISEVHRLAKHKGGETLKYIVVIGIGGSNLGAKAIYDAMGGAYDSIAYGCYPQMIFLDTCDGRLLQQFLTMAEVDLREKSEFVVLIISKSGGTTETLVNAEILLDAWKKRFGPINDRVVAITDKDSALWNRAVKLSWDVLPIPAMVGGRYSVLSVVGLFPLALAGVDIDQLCVGARNARKDGLMNDYKKNPAMRSACFIFEHYKKGFCIHDSFFFDPSLESLGKWYRQLVGESLGKVQSGRWRKMRTGITPTVSIGSTDLHSVGQLYLAGPRDKISSLVWRTHTEDELSVPRTLVIDKDKDFLKQLKPAQVMRAIFDGVVRTYVNEGLPHMRIEMSDDVSDLGYFLQWRELETMFLAHLMKVYAFDQPAVELYKKETRAILGKKR